MSAADLLPAARAAGAAAGVTRLAEITRLDRFGLPVWQAVRPMSRALSVHQGKGATVDDARLGALLEAVESDAAERFDTDGPTCAFDALEARSRAEQIGDFAADRDRPPEGASEMRWIAADRLDGGGSLFLPFDLVSLDFTRGLPSRLARSSNGLASGATRDDAVDPALHELIERDALIEWSRSGTPFDRMSAAVDCDGIGVAWFEAWRDRLRAERISLRVHHLPTVTGSPMFVCELNDFSKHGDAYLANLGFGCHALPEIALFRALAEALQARVTVIAGARDDLRPELYAQTAGASLAYAPPLPPGKTGKDFSSIAPGPVGVKAIAEALARVGYARSAMVELARPAGLFVARAFVCGLGAGRRRRRAPA